MTLGGGSRKKNKSTPGPGGGGGGGGVGEAFSFRQSVSFTQSLKQLIMSTMFSGFHSCCFHNSLISRCGARRTWDGRVAIGGSGGVGGAGGGGGVGLGVIKKVQKNT